MCTGHKSVDEEASLLAEASIIFIHVDIVLEFV